jgi:hypothetical protein
MSTELDRTERLLGQSLTRHAADAPSDGPLLTAVHARLRRRRRTRTIGAAVLASASVAAAFVVASAIGDHAGPSRSPAVASDGRSPAVATDGWRWESYGGLEVQVPSAWGYTGDPSQPCLAEPGARPFVRRPGPSTAVGCAHELPALNSRAAYVSLGPGHGGTKTFDHGWVRETRVIAGTALTVLADDPILQRRILGSARAISGTDVYGCTPSHPAAFRPTERPQDNGGLAAVGSIESVSVCSYSFLSLEPDPAPPLYSGRRLTGPDAARLVEAITAAPEGSGPNDPSTCLPDYWGDRIYVLVVHGSAREQQVVVRYAACHHNGTDDGAVQRQLTAEVLRPLWTGPDALGGMSGVVGRLLHPDQPVK